MIHPMFLPVIKFILYLQNISFVVPNKNIFILFSLGLLKDVPNPELLLAATPISADDLAMVSFNRKNSKRLQLYF